MGVFEGWFIRPGLQQKMMCYSCKGWGGWFGLGNSFLECSTCKGTGLRDKYAIAALTEHSINAS